MTHSNPFDALQATVALNDAAAHARALASQVAKAIEAIRTHYPTLRLGGQVERLQHLTVHATQHALALTVAADRAMGIRPEAPADGVSFGEAVPPAVLALFEAAVVIRHPVSLQEAGQAAAGGKLVVLRDFAAQGARLVPQYGAIFEASVDPAVVRLWWPRVFHEHAPVAIVELEVDGVWQETTLETREPIAA